MVAHAPSVDSTHVPGCPHTQHWPVCSEDPCDDCGVLEGGALEGWLPADAEDGMKKNPLHGSLQEPQLTSSQYLVFHAVVTSSKKSPLQEISVGVWSSVYDATVQLPPFGVGNPCTTST